MQSRFILLEKILLRLHSTIDNSAENKPHSCHVLRTEETSECAGSYSTTIPSSVSHFSLKMKTTEDEPLAMTENKKEFRNQKLPVYLCIDGDLPYGLEKVHAMKWERILFYSSQQKNARGIGRECSDRTRRICVLRTSRNEENNNIVK